MKLINRLKKKENVIDLISWIYGNVATLIVNRDQRLNPTSQITIK